MRKNFTTVSLASCAFFLTGLTALHAQPVITSAAVMPAVGTTDTLYTAAATVPPGSGGLGITWDLSALTLTNVARLTIIDGATTPYISTFPTANFCFTLDAGTVNYHYHRKSATGLEDLAVNYAGVGTGEDFTPNPRLTVPFPFHYLDAVVDTYQAIGSSAEVHTLTYDGYGTLITPFHTYSNVIRVKEYYGPTHYHYTWFMTSPFQIIIDYSSSGSYNYVAVRPEASSVANAPGSAAASLFPNPATARAVLHTDLDDYANVSLVITDIAGRLLANIPVSGRYTQVQTATIPKGLCFYQLFKKGTVIANGTMVVQ